MAREIVNTPNAPRSAEHGKFSFSRTVRAAGLVFVCGQGPYDPVTGTIAGPPISIAVIAES